MTAASRSLATALWRARFASGLLRPCYTTTGDTTIANDRRKPLARYGAMESALGERLAPAVLHYKMGHDRHSRQRQGISRDRLCFFEFTL